MIDCVIVLCPSFPGVLGRHAVDFGLRKDAEAMRPKMSDVSPMITLRTFQPPGPCSVIDKRIFSSVSSSPRNPTAPSSMAPPPRRNSPQNPARRKVRPRAPPDGPRPLLSLHQFRGPTSLTLSATPHPQGEEPWLAASLRPANFLPGIAIGFLLGLLLDLSSSWRPKSRPAPAPAAAPARGSSSNRASKGSFGSGGEELKMVSRAASVLRKQTRGGLCCCS